MSVVPHAAVQPVIPLYDYFGVKVEVPLRTTICLQEDCFAKISSDKGKQALRMLHLSITQIQNYKFPYSITFSPYMTKAKRGNIINWCCASLEKGELKLELTDEEYAYLQTDDGKQFLDLLIYYSDFFSMNASRPYHIVVHCWKHDHFDVQERFKTFFSQLNVSLKLRLNYQMLSSGKTLNVSFSRDRMKGLTSAAGKELIESINPSIQIVEVGDDFIRFVGPMEDLQKIAKATDMFGFPKKARGLINFLKPDLGMIERAENLSAESLLNKLLTVARTVHRQQQLRIESPNFRHLNMLLFGVLKIRENDGSTVSYLKNIYEYLSKDASRQVPYEEVLELYVKHKRIFSLRPQPNYKIYVNDLLQDKSPFIKDID